MKIVRLKRTIFASLLLLVASAAALYFLFLEWDARGEQNRARLVIATGPVFTVSGGFLPERASGGDIWLENGSHLKTGRTGFALLLLPGGHMLEATGNVSIKIESIENRRFALEQGNVLIRAHNAHEIYMDAKKFHLPAAGQYRFWLSDAGLCDSVSTLASRNSAKKAAAQASSARNGPEAPLAFPEDGAVLARQDFEQFSKRDDIEISQPAAIWKNKGHAEFSFSRWAPLQKEEGQSESCRFYRIAFRADFLPVAFRQQADRLEWSASPFDSAFHLVASSDQAGRKIIVNRMLLRPFYDLADSKAAGALFARLETRSYLPGLVRSSGQISLGKGSPKTL